MKQMQTLLESAHRRPFILAHARTADPHNQGDLLLRPDWTQVFDREARFHSNDENPSAPRRRQSAQGESYVANRRLAWSQHSDGLQKEFSSRNRNLFSSQFVFTIVTKLLPCCHHWSVGLDGDQIRQNRSSFLIINPMPPPSSMVGTAAITEDMLKRRWSVSILRYLDRGITDPAEITKNEANLSPAIMSQRLRTMLRYALVARYPRPAPSKVVEFRLTPRGKKILKMLDIIEKLDQLDQRLALNGKTIEEDLGITVPAPADRLPDPEPAVSDKPAKRKKYSATASLNYVSVNSLP
jgi:DNA-binding HxlR family transcriptional regulator